MTINIALTSFPRRITNCVKVISSVLGNTVLPDRIYLTLSHLEFPNYEQDLPQDLFNLIMTSDRIILNWVEENTKSMKKVFPILPYLEDDDIIIPIDDDMLIPSDFIESRMNDFNANGCEHPITSNAFKSVNMDNLIFTVNSLVQKKMLRGYDVFVNDVVLSTGNDDRTCLYLCQLNGYKLKPCTKWCNNQDVQGVQPLPIAPRSDYQYQIGPLYDNTVAPIISQISGGKTIGDCFGLFNTIDLDDLRKKMEKEVKKEIRLEKKIEKEAIELEIDKPQNDNPQLPIPSKIQKIFQYNLKTPVKHDLVYVLGSGSKYENLEVKISITSMLKFCSDWIGNIYVIGENPRICNKRVRHIYVQDVTRSNKDANIIYKIYQAIMKIPNLTENFLFCSDDILVTKQSSWEDFSPRYVFEYNQDDSARKHLRERSKNNKWDTLLLQTLDRFLGYREHIYFYEPHIFAPINKRYFKQMCQQIDYLHQKNVIVMSLWFNWLNLHEPQQRFDHQSFFTAQGVPANLNNVPRHITYNDKAFSVKSFRDNLINLVTMKNVQ